LSLFTAGNIAAGYYAITQTLQGSAADPSYFNRAALAIGFAIPFDALDGRIARLTNTTIDGMNVASPESGVRQIKFDAIPADLVESVEINKTLQANMDADGIGGSVNLVTKTAGERPTVALSGMGGFMPILGGRGQVLEQAMHYSQVLFSGAVSIWLVNTLSSVLRGTSDMKLPSATLIGVAIVQIVVGGALGLGLAGLPQFGMRGVAAGQLIAFSLGTVFLAWVLISGRSRLTLEFRAFTFQRDMFFDILKVGAISCLSPLQSVLSILIFTKILAGFGTVTLAGYGMGSRLEFLLIPIAFAFGVASVPMVGMAMGAGLVKRARQVAWTAGAAAGITVGLVGLIVAIDPALWVSLFTSDPGVTAAAYSYFAWAGPGFGFFGMGVCLYFSSQGAAKVGGPVLAGTIRLILVGLGGWWLAATGAPPWTLFALVGAAMVVFGLSTALSIRLTRWGK